MEVKMASHKGKGTWIAKECRDRALDLWKEGTNATDIALLLNKEFNKTYTAKTIRSFVYAARKAGDERASYHEGHKPAPAMFVRTVAHVKPRESMFSRLKRTRGNG